MPWLLTLVLALRGDVLWELAVNVHRAKPCFFATPTGWCPNCGLEGKLKASHNKPGRPVRYCGLYSLSQQQAEEAFLGL